jgi:hypothetical protein
MDRVESARARETDMTKRRRLSLLYSGAGAVRWAQTAASNGDANLARRCVWQWKNAGARAPAAGERLQLSLPENPDYQFERARK